MRPPATGPLFDREQRRDLCELTCAVSRIRDARKVGFVTLITLVLDLERVFSELDKHFHTSSGMLQAMLHVPSKIQLLNQLLQSWRRLSQKKLLLLHPILTFQHRTSCSHTHFSTTIWCMTPTTKNTPAS